MTTWEEVKIKNKEPPEGADNKDEVHYDPEMIQQLLGKSFDESYELK